MCKHRSYGLGMAALLLLLPASASAATLARQCGAFGIVTYDSSPMPTASATLARQCGAFGIVTYDPVPLTVTITFDANGGELGAGDSSRRLTVGAAIGELSVPERSGYAFDGWYTAASGGTKVTAVTVVTGDVTCYAQWRINQYVIAFDANGGDGGVTNEQDYASEIVAPTVTRTGYTFTGWQPALLETVPASNVTYFAQWTVNQYAIAFDANGGVYDGGDMSVDYDSAYGELPTPTREGYTFKGWTADGVAVTPESVMGAADVSLVAQWQINQYAVTFDANGGEGGATNEQDYASEIVAPTVTRTGYTFAGWQPALLETVPASNVTYSAQWTVNKYTITFDANGGVGGTAKTQDYGTALTAPTVTREGYTFTGWSPSVPSTVPASDATYTAQWERILYTVTFNMNGADGAAPAERQIAHGDAVGALPTVTRDGFSFDGWFTAASGGSAVSAETVITGAATFYAHWTEQALYPTPVWFDEEGEEIDWTAYYEGDEEPFAAEAAATFDGYVLDGEEVCGIIQVKAGKANRKNGTSTVSASLTLLGEAKKRSYKGTLSKRGVAVLTCSGKGDLSLCLGTNAMWGEVDGLTVSGARNVFAKSGDPKAAALSKWKGAYTLALETVDASGAGARLAWGYSGLALSVEAKGKVKVSGTMIDGAKVSITSQLLVGEKRCCIPVVVPLYSKKGGFAFNLWLHDDGTIEVGELSAWNAAASKPPFTAWFGEDVQVARTGASLPSSMSFMLSGEPDIGGMEVLYGFLPWEVPFTTGSKWAFPAAGSVKYDKEEDDYVDSKNSSNPSGLKLTYVSKTGAFKGTFKIYAVDASGRLKKYTANVSGVMVGRLGYGTATAKGVGSWPVFLE